MSTHRYEGIEHIVGQALEPRRRTRVEDELAALARDLELYDPRGLDVIEGRVIESRAPDPREVRRWVSSGVIGTFGLALMVVVGAAGLAVAGFVLDNVLVALIVLLLFAVAAVVLADEL